MLEISFDYSLWQKLGQMPPWQITWMLILLGGWIPLVVAMTWGLKEGWKFWRQCKFAANFKWIVLAIDVPRIDEKDPLVSLKSMENMFNIVSGSRRNNTWWEEWWRGQFTIRFSFEIVSIDGYVQYLVRVEQRFRKGLEAAIYSQFPDAEIVEVEDYTKQMPDEFPNDDGWEIWGTEYNLDKPDCYPIRTYPYWEDQFTGKFIDPLAGVLELFSSLKKGEQFWMQWVIQPLDNKWVVEGQKEVEKLIGKKTPAVEPDIITKAIQGFVGFLYELTGWLVSTVEASPEKEESKYPTLMQFMTEGQKMAVAAIEAKLGKYGFKTHLRALYWAKREVFDIQRFVSHFHGTVRQFGSMDGNAFSRDFQTKTAVDYYFRTPRIKERKRKIVKNYKAREVWAGAKGFTLNSEELASVWHFPTQVVRAPLVSGVSSKRSEPPIGLPTEDDESPFKGRAHAPKGAPPANMPI